MEAENSDVINVTCNNNRTRKILSLKLSGIKINDSFGGVLAGAKQMNVFKCA